uniref:Uncharacterized protein n=1 Tax=Romanomermis culicivorax TaxID=13658 RepID=A0A915KKN6_ROMCU
MGIILQMGGNTLQQPGAILRCLKQFSSPSRITARSPLNCHAIKVMQTTEEQSARMASWHCQSQNQIT